MVIYAGGDVRIVKDRAISLNPFILGRYLVRAPFGSEGWIISINNMEDLVGGHYWVSIGCLLGGIWHITTTPSRAVLTSFLWSAEAYLSYSLWKQSTYTNRHGMDRDRIQLWDI